MMVPRVLIRQLHRWLAWIVGIQILAWTASGFVMSFFPIERVRGEHQMAAVVPPALDGDAVVVGVAEVLARTEGVASLRLKRWLERQVYELELADGQRRLVDAASGETLSPLDRETAEAVARADFAGAGNVVAVEWLERGGTEFRGQVPVWQVSFDDEEETRLYVSPHSGEVVARRNQVWRLYDFFWMLHIMDYREREDFNHPLVVTAAAVAVVVSITGVVLLVLSLRRRRRRAQAEAAGG